MVIISRWRWYRRARRSLKNALLKCEHMQEHVRLVKNKNVPTVQIKRSYNEEKPLLCPKQRHRPVFISVSGKIEKLLHHQRLQNVIEYLIESSYYSFLCFEPLSYARSVYGTEASRQRSAPSSVPELRRAQGHKECVLPT
jgi:hypothetical protein